MRPDPNIIDWRWIAAAADLARQHDMDSFELFKVRGEKDVCIRIVGILYNFSYYIESGGILADDEI